MRVLMICASALLAVAALAVATELLAEAANVRDARDGAPDAG
jgi:hypothetical protein